MLDEAQRYAGQLVESAQRINSPSYLPWADAINTVLPFLRSPGSMDELQSYLACTASRSVFADLLAFPLVAIEVLVYHAELRPPRAVLEQLHKAMVARTGLFTTFNSIIELVAAELETEPVAAANKRESARSLAVQAGMRFLELVILTRQLLCAREPAEHARVAALLRDALTAWLADNNNIPRLTVAAQRALQEKAMQ